MASREWKQRKRLAYEAAEGICQRCFLAPATDTHHLTYDRKFHERPEDLAALCHPCHRYESDESDEDPAVRAVFVALELQLISEMCVLEVKHQQRRRDVAVQRLQLECSIFMAKAQLADLECRHALTMADLDRQHALAMAEREAKIREYDRRERVQRLKGDCLSCLVDFAEAAAYASATYYWAELAAGLACRRGWSESETEAVIAMLDAVHPRRT